MWQLCHLCHVLLGFFILFSVLILNWKLNLLQGKFWNVRVELMLIYGKDGDCVTAADVIHLDLI